ncbi:MAG: prolyl oligopeptidase family serine peptidase [bacterium]|nr:prolyl oligopeptidase family serine peptidase [bacterium]
MGEEPDSGRGTLPDRFRGIGTPGIPTLKKEKALGTLATLRGTASGAVLACAFAIACSALAADLETEPAMKPSKDLPVPGDVFLVEGRTAFIISPAPAADTATPTPWVWYAPTLPGLPGKEETWMVRKFLDAGIAVAGIDVGESFGSPKGRALYTAFYEELVDQRGFSKTPCLLARSRGGLMLYNWAVEHPASVACIAGIYPVCNLTSYPGLERACGAYDMTAQELADALAEHNPVDRVKPLAKARVPILHIHGDVDTIVPIEANSAKLADEYRRHGGKMKLTVMEGQGHNMWRGWFQCQELVDFVVKHAREKRPEADD